MVEVNFLAVLAAGVASMLVGWLWYSPMLFGNLWMKLSGVKMPSGSEMKTAMMRGYIVGFLLSLLTAYVLSHFVDYTGATTTAEGAATAFWVWLGFTAPLMMGSVLWEGKPLKLWFLNAGNNLVTLLIMGMIVAAWA